MLQEAAGGDILVPHVLLQLEDDLERSHRREAVWISVAVHLFAIIFLLLSPKIFGYNRVLIANPGRHHAQQAADVPRHASGPADAAAAGAA